jgi:pimeloyl-ACP methyl ester carboxylesterase
VIRHATESRFSSMKTHGKPMRVSTRLKSIALVAAALWGVTSMATGADPSSPESGARARAPIVIDAQGSFAVGGKVRTEPGSFDALAPTKPDGQTVHGDHARVFYQHPAKARSLPLVFWHGFGQSMATWQTTPDGREGFQNLFLRRRYSVYLIDQPRRGSAGRSLVPGTVPAKADEQLWFVQFRLGTWPALFDGVQFPRGPQALEQYFRSMTPDTAPFDAAVAIDATSALVDRIGPAILVTHSHSGGLGWTTVMNNPKVRAVVSFEPGSGFVFPEGEAPPTMPSAAGPLEPMVVPLERFKALTRVPIVVYYGDNIPEQPSNVPGLDNWRVRLSMARLWVESVNRHGGDATLVHLPTIGIRGNTHFPFSDMNNAQIAVEMVRFLSRKGLDR